ncbi:Heterokaryon incompatibility protein 6, OR allele [Pseudocercospora fuligena]|uniref:Heterokaryon incompatibility protein 6, OR allele n=1 Tax=Pseudocercospora fuligena TaxID=685502 RepID=A0A8H6RCB4_9PEZI|nr:Heterokaryon incompatibility protein 6, OR allele [Pseudocercospora fuligena]
MATYTSSTTHGGHGIFFDTGFVIEDTSPYQKLDERKRQCRLARLRFALDEVTSLVCLEMATFSLDDQEQWKALSYCWGEEKATEPVLLLTPVGYDEENEATTMAFHIFLVRPNLHSFLLQMHKDGEHAWFFIDAICINQDDLAERASQVRLMREIYKRARKVVVWLTLDSSLPGCNKEKVVAKYHRDEQLVANLISSFRWKDWISAVLVRRKSHRGFIIGTMMSNYWTRLWVVQELLLAEVLELRLGFHTYTPDQVVAYFHGEWGKGPGDRDPNVIFNGRIVGEIWLTPQRNGELMTVAVPRRHEQEDDNTCNGNAIALDVPKLQSQLSCWMAPSNA